MTACGERGDTLLPEFTDPGSGKSVTVDVEAASGGAALLDSWGDVELTLGDDVLAFKFWGMSHAKAAVMSFGELSLDEPPVRVSPTLTPGDGIMDMYVALGTDGNGSDLHYHLYLDTDWQDIVEGDVFIRTMEIPDRRVVFGTVTVDFSEAVAGVYHRDIVFAGAAHKLPGPAPVLEVSNGPGESLSYRNVVTNLDGFEPGHVVVGFGGGDCAWRPDLQQSGLGGEVRATIRDIPEECPPPP